MMMTFSYNNLIWYLSFNISIAYVWANHIHNKHNITYFTNISSVCQSFKYLHFIQSPSDVIDDIQTFRILTGYCTQRHSGDHQRSSRLTQQWWLALKSPIFNINSDNINGIVQFTR